MSTHWEQWTTDPRAYGDYLVEVIFYDTQRRFKIILIDETTKKRIVISYDILPPAYNVIHADLRVHIRTQANSSHNTDIYHANIFFKTTQSPYLQWLSRESRTLSEAYGLQQYTIAATNMLIDIICADEPHIKYIV